jgi:hypothetical protein
MARVAKGARRAKPASVGSTAQSSKKQIAGKKQQAASDASQSARRQAQTTVHETEELQPPGDLFAPEGRRQVVIAMVSPVQYIEL